MQAVYQVAAIRALDLLHAQMRANIQPSTVQPSSKFDMPIVSRCRWRRTSATRAGKKYTPSKINRHTAPSAWFHSGPPSARRPNLSASACRGLIQLKASGLCAASM